MGLIVDNFAGGGGASTGIEAALGRAVDIAINHDEEAIRNAQGFPADYQIETDAHGKTITKTAQVAKCGNSVCPPLSEAIARANMADEIAEREVQAA